MRVNAMRLRRAATVPAGASDNVTRPRCVPAPGYIVAAARARAAAAASHTLSCARASRPPHPHPAGRALLNTFVPVGGGAIAAADASALAGARLCLRRPPRQAACMGSCMRPLLLAGLFCINHQQDNRTHCITLAMHLTAIQVRTIHIPLQALATASSTTASSTTASLTACSTTASMAPTRSPPRAPPRLPRLATATVRRARTICAVCVCPADVLGADFLVAWQGRQWQSVAAVAVASLPYHCPRPTRQTPAR